jgi:hypothetical protein
VRLPLLSFLIALVLLPSLRPALAQGSHPRPPGLQQAEKNEAQSEQSMPPSPPPRRKVDFSKLRSEADELASLAQSIPPDVDRVRQGVLAKDLASRLKRIEKLSKHLQSQLDH